MFCYNAMYKVGTAFEICFSSTVFANNYMDAFIIVYSMHPHAEKILIF